MLVCWMCRCKCKVTNLLSSESNFLGASCEVCYFCGAHTCCTLQSLVRFMLPLKVAARVGSRQQGFIKALLCLSDCCEVHHGVVGFYSQPVIGGNYRGAFRSASEVVLSVYHLDSPCISIFVQNQLKYTMMPPSFIQ